MSQRTAPVANLVKYALKRRQVGHDEMARGILEANNGCWIALRRRNERPADVIDRLPISAAREERHGADRLFDLPAIRVTSFLAKTTQKCADRHRGDRVSELRVQLSVSPDQLYPCAQVACCCQEALIQEDCMVRKRTQ